MAHKGDFAYTGPSQKRVDHMEEDALSRKRLDHLDQHKHVIVGVL